MADAFSHNLAAHPKSSGERSPTPSKVSYLEIARVHRQLWRNDGGGRSWAIAGAVVFQVTTTLLTVRLLG
jgi:hypothetical protein